MEPQHLISIKAALQEKRAPLYRFIVRWMWRLLTGGITAVVILFLIINFTAIPSFRELEDPSSALASEVVANTGEVLGRYFIENRVPVAYEDLNPHLVNALVATEDERFFSHCGIDARAVGRVVFRTILLRDQSAGGGSTITQQLAKMLYSDRNFQGMGKIEKFFALAYRKLREWITAVKLERSYTKEEIIAMYLNQFNFINNAYGVHAASEVYFGKDQSELSVEQAATLIGMLQNPSRFNPVHYEQRAMRRRWIVLYQMRNNGMLTEAQFDELKIKPLGINFKKVTFTDDKAPYLCAELKKDLDKILDAPECRRPDGSKYNIYKDGLRIYTTIDPVYQRHAEAAMQEHMKKIQGRFFQTWRGRDPWTYRSEKTTAKEIDIRKASLWSRIRESERYQSVWPKYFDAISERVKKRYNFDLRDTDVERMMEEEKRPGALSQMVADTIVNFRQAADYRRVMNGPEWLEIKNQYRALQAAIKKLYETKTKMKVFAWDNPRLEKDTFMSPLDSIRYHRMHLQTGIMAVDPTTSEIKAWVGGINFKYFQYDHIRTDRQVGSTFKPFVYATAIAQQSISPCFSVYDQAVTIPARYQNFTNITDWTPKDASGTYTGLRMTLKEALKNSVNSISTYLMKQMGDTEPVRGLCNNLGIDSSLNPVTGRYRIPKQPSICLGVADLTVWEMTGAYAAFANKGMYGLPFVIKEIKDKNGRTIYRSLPEEHAALPPNANYVLLNMLKYNVAGAPGVNTLKSEVGGKTGTTDDFTDGWFMGVTPRLVVGTWVGGDDRWIRFRSFADGQGARMARPIFAGFVGRLEKDAKSGYDFNARFVRPQGDLGIETNCANYAEGEAAPTQDEEDFFPDIYNDQLNEDGSIPGQKPKKPDANFGDELEGGNR